MNKVDLQIGCIQEYMSAAQDLHDAMLLLNEAKMRVRSAIESNRKAKISVVDPLGLTSQIINTPTGSTLVEAVVNQVTTVAPAVARTNSESTRRTKNSPRNSPGTSKRAVYNALPGDVHAIMKRTGLSDAQVYAAAADLLGGDLIERHGTRGNTTYTIKGDKKNWSAKQFAKIYTNK